MTTTTLVVPCFNESDRLPVGEFRRFLARHQDISVLFVDDGSTDNTRTVLARLQSVAPEQVNVLCMSQNRGKAEAVRCGILEAFRHTSQFVAYWDADLATPLEAALQFRRVLQEKPHTQIVMGARVQLLGRQVQRRWSRQLLGRMFAWAASRALGLTVFDTQCGAKMFRVQRSNQLLFEAPFHSRWIFDVEMLARFLLECRAHAEIDAERAIYEIPLDQWQDVAGSKLKLRDFGKAALELARIRRQYAPGIRTAPAAEPSIFPLRQIRSIASVKLRSNSMKTNESQAA